MRSAIEKSPNGLEVRCIAGTYVVLIAMNCPPEYREGLLGFGIRRKDHTNDEEYWLPGLKRFQLHDSDEGDEVTTRRHPVQKFHWGDYTTKPGRTYTYTVVAMEGKPGALVQRESVSVTVTCEKPEAVGQNGHAVHFNRSAAASQAFSRRFPSLPKGDVEDPKARTWLSRGLLEALIAFIDGTQTGEGLHLFLYEFEMEECFAALVRARVRGVKLEILYDDIWHAHSKGPGLKSLAQIRTHKLDAVCKARNGKGIGISHNKFMVRTNANGKPVAVWTGSTNFSDAAIYGQSNVGHQIDDSTGRGVIGQYFDWHQAIWKDPGQTAAASRKAAVALTSVPPAAAVAGTSLVLSPRSSIEAVTACASLVSKSQRMVCFTAPFAMQDDLEKALATAPSQVFGLLNTAGVIGSALQTAPNTGIAVASALSTTSILDAWQGALLKESQHHSGVFVHTKFLLIDPLSDHPVVVTGSANFSTNSSKSNDENQLFIFGDKAVADVYLGEFMRMYDHYYFRSKMKAHQVARATNPRAGYLDGTSAWSDKFFNGGSQEAMRLAFF